VPHSTQIALWALGKDVLKTTGEPRLPPLPGTWDSRSRATGDRQRRSGSSRTTGMQVRRPKGNSKGTAKHPQAPAQRQTGGSGAEMVARPSRWRSPHAACAESPPSASAFKIEHEKHYRTSIINNILNTLWKIFIWFHVSIDELRLRSPRTTQEGLKAGAGAADCSFWCAKPQLWHGLQQEFQLPTQQQHSDAAVFFKRNARYLDAHTHRHIDQICN